MADDVPSRFQVDFTGQTLLGTYRVAKKLAEGGMGSVYVAEDTNLGRSVVVKVPHARFLGEPGFRARFRREVSELVRLEHPHVVRILARGEQDDVPFFVLQYLGGGSLEDRLRGGRQSVESVDAWLGPIARTLDFVHGRGVVHRDVKPGNILFDEEGHVFLSDFGVVKALGPEEDGEMTDVGTGIGSPMYMSPEQGMGRGVTASADQYALASTLYEALAGEPPYGRGSVVQILLRKEKEDPPPLGAAVPGIPAEAGATVARALSRDPGRRHPSCTAFADAFRRAVEPAAAQVARPRSRAAVVLLVVGLAAAVGVGALTRGFGLLGAETGAATPVMVPVDVLFALASPGEEPRRQLRYRLAPGTEQKVTLRFDYAATQKMGAMEIPPSQWSAEQDVDVRVESVDRHGRARVAWVFPPVRPIDEKGLQPAQIAAIRKMAEAVGTLTGSGTMAPRGGVLEVSVRAERPIKKDELFDPAGNAEESVRLMGVVLPEEPVGRGAVWDVSRLVTSMGLRYQETVTYELTSLEGDTAQLRLQIRNSAPDQRLEVPGMDEGMQAKIRTFSTSGSGRAVLALDRPLLVDYDATSTLKAEIFMDIPEGPDTPAPEDRTMIMESTVSVRLTAR